MAQIVQKRVVAMHDSLPSHPSGEAPRDFAERFREVVEHVRHLLPAQGPIGEFIHHNTLHAYQHLPFHEALAAAGEEHDAQVYWPEPKLRLASAKGDFGPRDVEAALDERYRTVVDTAVGPLTRRRIERAILLGDVLGVDIDDVADADASDGALPALYAAAARAVADAKLPVVHRGVTPHATHRDFVLALSGIDPAPLVDAQIVRFLGAYLDDGLARWSMPSREEGLLRCFVAFVSTGRSLQPEFVRRAHIRLARTTAPGALDRLVEGLFEELGVPESEEQSYLTRMMLELPGFAGMVAVIEGSASAQRAIPSGALADLVRIRLALSVEALRDSTEDLGYRGPLTGFPAFARAKLPEDLAVRERDIATFYELCRLEGLSAGDVVALGASFARDVVDIVTQFDSPTRRRIFHEAMEHAHLRSVVGAIAENRDRPAQIESPTPRFQVMFCIDDREEGIRRHFEELDPRHVTYGVAGFFGIAMAFQAFDNPNAKSLCPIVVKPAHAVFERAAHGHGDAADRFDKIRRAMALADLEIADASRSFFRGLFITPLLGLLAVFPLVLRVLFPRAGEKIIRGLSESMLPKVHTDLVLEREESETESPSNAGKLVTGFTLQERADRVAGTLENVGLVKNFATIVTLLGHGASTVNNPHHSAYDCGACGGSNGGPNARAFARMANDRAVRAELAKRGIVIPDGTWFVGGWHDTTTDGITLFDLDKIPAELASEFTALRRCLDAARARSAHERCRRFEHAPLSLAPEQALRHVEERSVDLSQARPELGHATNAACIVGRRSLSRGLFLDRRSFLVSYDPTIDPETKILERILAAVGPVGAGINLEYYFSSVDPDRWGCGTKLPHNLVGLVGVMEGGTGDLRTGLPREMTEVHEPVRLLIVVDASTEAVLKVAERVDVVRELVVNGWVRLVCVDPDTGAIDVFTERGFVPVDVSDVTKLPVVRSAVDWYRGRRDSLPPARIAPSASFVGGTP